MMKRFQPILACILTLVLLLGTVAPAAADLSLPTGLNHIEEEAFAGDSSLTGILTLPSGTASVGANALRDTGLYALNVPASVGSFAAQESLSLMYVHFLGSSTAVEGNAFSNYVFAPAGSPAAAWAANSSATLVTEADLTTHGGFYYQLHDGMATLLCPVDPTAVDATVVIPLYVKQNKVTSLSANAFSGCAQVTSVTLPYGVAAVDGAYSGCPNAEIITQKPTEIRLSATSVKLTNETPYYQLSAEVISSTFSDKRVRYESLNYGVADVASDGTITAGKDGVTYINVIAADGTIASCRVEVDLGAFPVSIAQAPDHVSPNGTFQLTLATDNANVPPMDQWLAVDKTYFNKDGMAIMTYRESFHLTAASETFEVSVDRPDAACVMLTIVDNGWSVFTPGSVPTLTIDIITDSEAPQPAYIWGVNYNTGYPGSYGKAYVQVLNPEALTQPVPVSVSSPDGLVDVQLGTLSQDTTSLSADIQFPETWQYVNDDGETENSVTFSIGGETYSYEIYLYGLADITDVYLGVGQTNIRSQSDYCIFPAQQPLTFTVADPTVASVDSDGSITGLAIGTTTCTITTRTGHTKTFTISVAPDASRAEVENPPISIDATYKTILWQTTNEYYQELFTLTQDIPESLESVVNVVIAMTAYDQNDEQVGQCNWYIGFSNSTFPSVELTLNSLYSAMDYEPGSDEERIHKVVATIKEGEGYSVGERNTATIQFAYTDSESGLPEFQCNSGYGMEYAPGATVSMNITCTTPELLTEPVTINAVPLSPEMIASVTPVTLSAEEPSGTIILTLSTDVINGSWCDLYIYAGSRLIDENAITIADTLNEIVYELMLAIGDTIQFPLILDEAVDASSLLYKSYSPEVAMVDQTGKITTLSEGYAELTVSSVDKYGTQSICRLDVLVIDEAIDPDMPTLSLSTSATTVKFGEPMVFTATLDATPEWGPDDPESIDLYYNAVLLDSQKQMLTTIETYTQLDANNQFSFKNWMAGFDIARIKYLYLLPTRYGTCQIDHTPCLIEVTDVPQAGETIYVLKLSDPPYRLDDSLAGQIVRLNIEGVYEEAEYAFKASDGTELCSGWMSEDSETYFEFMLEDMTVGQEYAYDLWVNGENTGTTLTFTVDEPALYLNFCPDRLLTTETGQMLDVYFSNENYTTTLTYASSDESILTIDESGCITPVGSGIATVSATSSRGQRVEHEVMVVDPEQCITPTIYLDYSDNTDVSWLGAIDIRFGTTTPLLQIEDYIYIDYEYEFLDQEGNVLCSQTKNDDIAFDPIKSEYTSSLYPDQPMWENAFIQKAAKIRIRMLECSDNSYIVDEERCQLTFDLPDTSTHAHPVFTFTADETSGYAVGEEFTIVVDCLNPDKISPYDTINLYDQSWNPLASYQLQTATLPLTLTATIPEDAIGNYQFIVEYPNTNYGTAERDFYLQIQQPPQIATTLAELQSEHNYPDDADFTLQYTYEGATKLEITFDELTQSELGYDFIRVGNPAQRKANDWPVIASDSQLAGETVTVTGDTVIINFTSDGGINYWGFAVSKIVAHLADGTTVEITE